MTLWYLFISIFRVPWINYIILIIFIQWTSDFSSLVYNIIHSIILLYFSFDVLHLYTPGSWRFDCNHTVIKYQLILMDFRLRFIKMSHVNNNEPTFKLWVFVTIFYFLPCLMFGGWFISLALFYVFLLFTTRAYYENSIYIIQDVNKGGSSIY